MYSTLYFFQLKYKVCNYSRAWTWASQFFLRQTKIKYIWLWKVRWMLAAVSLYLQGQVNMWKYRVCGVGQSPSEVHLLNMLITWPTQREKPQTWDKWTTFFYHHKLQQSKMYSNSFIKLCQHWTLKILQTKVPRTVWDLHLKQTNKETKKTQFICPYSSLSAPAPEQGAKNKTKLQECETQLIFISFRTTAPIEEITILGE